MPNYNATLVSTIEVIDLQDETLNPASTANAHLKVSDLDDATWISQIDDRTVDCYAKFNLSSDMVNPLSIDTMTAVVRFECHNTFNDDILTLQCQISEADGTTPLSDLTFICTHDQFSSDGTVHELTVPLQNIVTDPARWGGNQFWFNWNYNRSKGSDGLYISIKQVTIYGDYTADTNQYLTLENIEQQGQIQQGVLDQEHALTSENIVQQGQISPSSISIPVYDVESENISQQSAIEAGAIAQTHILNSENISQQSEVQQGVSGVPFVDLNGEHISQESAIQQGAVTQYVRVSQAVQIVGGVGSHFLTSQNIQYRGANQLVPLTIQHDVEGLHLDQGNEIQQSVATITSVLASEHIQQQSQLTQIAVGQEHNLIQEHIYQQCDIEDSTALIEHLLSSEHIQQTNEITESQTGSSGELILQNISQQSNITPSSILVTHLLSSNNISQQSAIEQSAITMAHNLLSTHVVQQSQVQQSVVAGEGELVTQHVQQQSQITQGTVSVTLSFIAENIQQQSAITQGAVSSQAPNMKTSTIDYNHPYATIYWRHQPTGGSWQDVINLSGYVSGQGTKTLTLNQAQPDEIGYLQCVLTNPAGASVYSDLAQLSGTPVVPIFTTHPTNLDIANTPTPFNFVDHPDNLTLEETVP